MFVQWFLRFIGHYLYGTIRLNITNIDKGRDMIA